MKICKNCRAETEDGAKFCPQCGGGEFFSVYEEKPSENKSQRNGLALAGMILGIVSCIPYIGFLLIPGILAIVFSSKGLKKSAENGGKGFATAGLVLGIISICVWGLLFLVEIIVLISVAGTGA